jgi:hypothetical protein
VLAAGIYLADRRNSAVAIARELGSARAWRVTQRWFSIGESEPPEAIRDLTIGSTRSRVPKFTLLNTMVGEALDDFDYVIVTDDDVDLPAGFVDAYLAQVERFDFALAQPARTHDSFIDHPFVEQLDGLDARRTQFVEIGPVFSIRRDAARHLLPFDETSPMGWGYDFVWPKVLHDAGLNLGIVDATPVAHRLRKPVAEYHHGTVDGEMRDYLATRPHVTRHEAFRILKAYA